MGQASHTMDGFATGWSAASVAATMVEPTGPGRAPGAAPPVSGRGVRRLAAALPNPLAALVFGARPPARLPRSGARPGPRAATPGTRHVVGGNGYSGAPAGPASFHRRRARIGAFSAVPALLGGLVLATGMFLSGPTKAQETEIWSATLTPATRRNAVGYCRVTCGGGDTHQNQSPFGTLSGHEFVIDGTTYQVDSIRGSNPATGQGNFFLQLDTALTETDSLMLHVGDASFALADSDTEGSGPFPAPEVGTLFTWAGGNNPPILTAGTAVTVRLVSLPGTRATGQPTISGTAQTGQTLTALLGTIADTDGLPSTTFPTGYTFQWIRRIEFDEKDEDEIEDATDQTYTLTSEDGGNQVRVKVSFTDGVGVTETLTSDEFPSEEVAINFAATGMPEITGTARVGEVVTATLGTIDDEDGRPSSNFPAGYTIRWIRVDSGTETEIENATSDTYTLMAADVGKMVKVRVSFQDADSFDEARESDPWPSSGTIASGSPATGKPVISGTARPGQTLTAAPGDIADADGLPSGTFPDGYTFQWIRVDSGTETEITNATSHNYTLTRQDGENRVRVRVSFTDGAGNAETLTSDPYPATGTVTYVDSAGNSPLLSNFGEPMDQVDTVFHQRDFIQGFRTGDHYHTLTSVDLRLVRGSFVGWVAPIVRILEGTSIDSGSDQGVTLTGQAINLTPETASVASTGNFTYTAPTGTVLRSNTQYFLLGEGVFPSENFDEFSSVGVEWRRTTSPREDAGPAEGWSIDNHRWSRARTSTGRFTDRRGGAQYLRINGVRTNTPPVVATAIPDQEVMAETVFSYQFPEDAFTDADATDTLTYSAELSNGNPLSSVWLSFDPASRTFSGTPQAGDVGTLTVKVTANDGNSGVAEDEFVITVGPPASTAVTLSVDVPSLAEGAGETPITVTATLDSATRDTDTQVQVTVGSGTAVEGTDFADVGAFSITIAAGAQSESGAFSLIPTDDDIDEVDETVSVSGATTVSELTVSAAVITITDDDTRGVTVSSGTLNVTEGSTSTYTVVLDSQPTGNVTVTPSSDDTGAVTVSGALTFTPSDWSTEQVVTVSGVDDGDSADENVTISHSVSGADYGAVTAADIAVSVDDDENSNTWPVVASPIPDRSVAVRTAFNYRLPEGTFTDADAGDTLSYAARQADGTTLPAWLAFDGATRTFSGTPPETGTVRLRVTASDPNGGLVSDEFVIRVVGLNVFSDTLVSNLGQNHFGNLSHTLVGVLYAQPFTIGGSASEYALHSVQLEPRQVQAGSLPRVSIYSTDEDGIPATRLYTLTNPDPISNESVNTFAAPAGASLLRNTTYAVVTERPSGDGFAVSRTRSTAEDAGSARGSSIANTHVRRDAPGSAFTTPNGVMRIAVLGRARASNPSTAVTLSVNIDTLAERAGPTTITVTAALDRDSRATTTPVAVTVGSAGTATAGTDYADVSDFTVTIPAHSRSGTGTFSLDPMFDSIDEGDETVSVNGTATGLTVTGTQITITDDETASAGVTLVSNLRKREDGRSNVSGFVHAQGFTTGGNPAGYRLTGIDIEFASAGTVTSAVVRKDDPATGDLAATLSGTGAASAGTHSFPAPDGTSLDPGTEYFLVIEGPAESTLHVSTTAVDTVDPAGQSGWSINNDGHYRAKTATTAFLTFTTAKRIRVNGYVKSSNTPATGKPVISGTATVVGAVLTADAGDLADAEGLPTTTFPDGYSFQWVRVDSDNSTETDILNATDPTYTLMVADAGMKVRVKVSFTDGAGNAETRTSDAYPSTGSIVRPKGVTVTPTSLDITEGNTGSYTVALDTQPTGNVTVTPSSGDSTSVTVPATALTFTTSDWSTEQSVTVTAVQDNDADNETVTITHSVSGADYNSVSAASVTVNVDDDEPPVTSLVSNMGQTPVASVLVTNSFPLAQQFTTGSHASGYLLAEAQVYVHSDYQRSDAARLSIWSANGSGYPDQELYALTNPDPVTNGAVNSFAAPAGAILLGDRQYVVVLESRAGSYAQYIVGNTSSASEDPGGASSWSIADNNFEHLPAGWSNIGGNPLRIAIRGSEATNTAPMVATEIPDQEATASALFRYQIPANSFTDADPFDSLTYTATLSDGSDLPDWLSFDRGMQTFTGIPTAAGTVTVKVTADDGRGGTVSDEFEILVRSPPAFVSNIGQQPRESNVLVAGSSGSAQRFTTGSNTSGYLLAEVGIQIQLRYAETDAAGVSIYSADGSGNPDQMLYELSNPATVTNGAENSFTAPAGAILLRDTPYLVVVERASGDGFDLGLTASNLEDAGAADGWSIADARSQRLHGQQNWSSRVDKLRIAVRGSAAPASTAPMVATALLDQTATTGAAFHYEFPANSFTDADSFDSLSYTATRSDDTALPDWLQFDAATRTFTGTPKVGDVGTLTVKVTADDGRGGMASDEFDIAVSLSASTAVDLSVNPPSLAEDASATTITVTATLDGETRDSETPVTVTIGSGTATEGTDFADVVADLAITIPANTQSQTGTFDLTPTEDIIDEEDETVSVSGSTTVSGLTVNAADVTITDNDDAPALLFSVSPDTIDEAGGVATVTVSTGAGSTFPDEQSIELSLGGTASKGSDYSIDNAMLTLPAGSGNSASEITTTITAIDDGFVEPDETINILANWNFTDVGRQTITITDDDTRTVTVTPTSLDIREGGTGSYTVVLESQPTRNVTVTPESSDPGAATVAPSPLTFTSSNWSTEQTVTVTAVNDSDDDNEMVTITHSVSGADYGSVTAADVAVNVEDDDIVVTTNRTTLVSNWDATVARTSGSAGFQAQSFETGPGIIVLADVQVLVLNAFDGPPQNLTRRNTSVSVRADDNGAPGDVVATLTNPASFTNGALNSFTAPTGTSTTLAANSTYWVSVNDGTSSNPVSFVNISGDDETGVAGWSIGDGRSFRQSETEGWSVSPNSLVLAIRGYTSANTVPVVATPLEDQAATADAAFSYQVPDDAFTDADSDELTYTAVESGETGLPSWLSFAAATRTISGTPAVTDAGTVTVKVTASDGRGGPAEDEFDIVVNAPATGKPTVTGGTNPGETVTAGLGTIADANGLPATFPDDYRFRWYRVEIDEFGEVGFGSQRRILGATSSSYTLTADDMGGHGEGGHRVHVEVNFTDGDGHEELYLYSENHPSEGTLGTLDAPAVAGQAALVSNTGQALDAFSNAVVGGANGSSSALQFTTGANASGYVLGSVQLYLSEFGGPDAARVRIYSDSSGNPGSSLYTLASPSPIVNNAFNTFTAPANATVAKETKYHVVAEATAGGYWLGLTAVNDEDAGAAGGWSIANSRRWKSTGNWSTASGKLRMSVNGTFNTSPVLAAALADQTATVGRSFEHQLPENSFTDADSDMLTWSATQGDGTDLPTWLTFAPATRTFSGTPAAADAGTVTVKVTVSDGRGGMAEDEFDIVVVQAPLVSNAGQTRGASFTAGPALQAQAFTTGSHAAGYALSDVQIHLRERSGAYAVQVTIWSADESDNPHEMLYTLVNPSSITDNAFNTFTAPADAILLSGTQHFVMVEATSGNFLIDGTESSSEDSGAATGWSIHNQRHHSSDGGSTWQSNNVNKIRMTIRGSEAANAPPAVSNALEDQGAVVDTSFEYTFADDAFTDADSFDTLTYSATLSDGTDLPSWLSFDAATRTFSGTPTSLGTITVKVTANDRRGGMADDEFDITVRQPSLVGNTGQPPGSVQTVTARLAQGFTTGGHASGYALSEVQVHFQDQSGTGEGRVTIWSADGSGNPHELLYTLANPSSIANSALNSFTAPADAVLLRNTQHFVVVEATSGVFHVGTTSSNAEDAGGADGWSVANGLRAGVGSAWTSAPGTNLRIAVRGTQADNFQPEVTNALMDQEATVGTAFSYQIPDDAFTDADSFDTLTYSATLGDGSDLPEWLAFDPGSRTFSGTPVSAGTITVKVTADDGRGGTADDEFDITVRQPALVSNIGQTPDTGLSTGNLEISAQQFTTGINASGYLLAEVEVHVSSYAGSDRARVSIWSVDSSGYPHESLYTLDNPATVTNDALNSFTAPSDAILLKETRYLVLVEGASGEFSIGDTLSAAEDSGGVAGWSIADHYTSSIDGGSTWGTYTTYKLRIAVRGSEAPASTAPMVAIPLEDQSATVGTAFEYRIPANSFTDADSFDTLTYSATLGDGSDLPEWLAFDPGSRTFSGTPVSAGTVTVKVTADDGRGGTVDDRFDIVVDPSAQDVAPGRDVALVSNVGQTVNETLATSNFDLAQEFTTGSNSSGYTLSSIDVRLANSGSVPILLANFPAVKVMSGSATGTVVATLSAGSASISGNSVVNLTYTAPLDSSLDASTEYYVVLDGGHVLIVGQGTNSDNEDAGGADGWSIADGGLRRGASSTGSFESVNHSWMIRVNGSVNGGTANNPATGKPAIAGTATVGEMLTAGAGDIADADGLPTTTFPDGYSFQWIRVESGSENDISGATGQTYTLDSLDAGNTVKVRVSFTDGAGNAETRTSDAYPSSGTVNARGVTVMPTLLEIGEGNTGSYTVVLDTQPIGEVTVTPVSGDTGAVTVSAALTFTATDWATAQTVTVTAVDDADADDESVTVTHSVAGADYASVTAANVIVNVDDDEVAVTTLVSNTGESHTNSLRVGQGIVNTFTRAQKFAIAGSASAYLLDSVQLDLRGEAGSDNVQVSIYTAGSDGRPDASLYTLANPGTITSGSLNTFTAPMNALISANTDYFVVVGALSGSFTTSHTNSNAEDTGGVSGSTIGDSSHETTGSGWSGNDWRCVSRFGVLPAPAPTTRPSAGLRSPALRWPARC